MPETILDYSHYFWLGSQIRLRAFTVDDADYRFAQSLDSVARQVFNLGMELPTTVELQKAYLEKVSGCQQVNNMIVFAIENLDNELAGVLTMHSIDERHGKFSFGILVKRQFRQRGYAEDAVRIVMKYGFRERRFQKSDSACAGDNIASIRLHQKLGFVEEGRRRRQWFYDGHFHDDILWGMTIEEYDANSAR
mgnify:CR=1 FL=1